MPTYIVKIADKYLEYSTITDSFVSPAMTLEQFKAYYLCNSKLKSDFAKEELESRLARVETRGTSCFNDSSARDTLSCNRCGEGEREK